MILILLLSMFSIGYTNQINNVSGNIEKFSLMNGNSFINNTIDGVDNNLYKISLIQYPGQISAGQFLYIERYKKYFIQSKITTINYGILSNENKNNVALAQWRSDLEAPARPLPIEAFVSTITRGNQR